jgi:glycosyltransferase involved in cell wall biosynthesis
MSWRRSLWIAKKLWALWKWGGSRALFDVAFQVVSLQRVSDQKGEHGVYKVVVSNDALPYNPPNLENALELPLQLLFSILLPTYESNLHYLKETISSVLAQTYPHWELCICDDHSSSPELINYLSSLSTIDNRIKTHRRLERGHIGGATKDAYQLARGNYITFLDHDDVLSPTALQSVVDRLRETPHVILLYTDEAIIDEEGVIKRTVKKPSWDATWILLQNYVCHLLVLKREYLESHGILQAWDPTRGRGAQDWDLILRVTEGLRTDEIAHIPQVLYYWRSHGNSTALSFSSKPYVVESQKEVVQSALTRRGINAQVTFDYRGSHLSLAPLRSLPFSVEIVVRGKRLSKTMSFEGEQGVEASKAPKTALFLPSTQSYEVLDSLCRNLSFYVSLPHCGAVFPTVVCGKSIVHRQVQQVGDLYSLIDHGKPRFSIAQDRRIFLSRGTSQVSPFCVMMRHYIYRQLIQEAPEASWQNDGLELFLSTLFRLLREHQLSVVYSADDAVIL